MRTLARFSLSLPMAAILTAANGGDLRLIEAVKKQDTKTARVLAPRRIGVNAAEPDGSTALHWAAHRDDVAIAELLIRSGARPGAATDTGVTPLHLACNNRSGVMVELLLKAKADPNAKLFHGETVLMSCARAGDARAIKALIAAGAEVNVKETEHDQTPLMWAAAQKHSEVVRLLLVAGADLKARSRSRPQTVVGEQTQRAGREKLNYTVMRGGSTALLFAARTGDVESAKLLLEFGANANDALADGTPALTLAAHSGQTGVGLALLEKGAEPNAMGAGYAPLHAAVLRGDLTLVKALLARGADPNLRMVKGTPVRRDTMDYNLLAPLIGSTPYLLAARFVEADIMRALRAGGADPNLAMPNGSTPLLLAAGLGLSNRASRRGIARIDFGKIEPESQVYEAVKAAIELGGEVNAVSQTGDTALHAAALMGHPSVVQLLADSRAQINAKNKQGQTPLKALLSPPPGRRVVVDDDDPTPVRRGPHPQTVALLRKLGATE